MISLFNYVRCGFYRSRLYYCGEQVQLYKGVRLREAEYISIGKGTAIDRNTTLSVTGNHKGASLIIGEYCSIGEGCHITASYQIEIGSHTLFGKHVTVTDNSHGKLDHSDIETPPTKREVCSKGGVKIGENVWIGEKATILPAVEIGNNCIIGANSVVTHSVPDNSIAVGNPARIVKQI